MRVALLIGIVASSPLLVEAFFFPSFSTDQGSYLMTRNWILGQDYTGLMPFHTRPPLIGIVLTPLTWLMGELWPGKLLTAVTLWVVAWGSYLLARVWLEPRKALYATFFATVNPVVVSLLIGGYLSVLALALSFVLIRSVLLRDYWKVPILAFIITGLNQTIPVNMAIVLLCFPFALWHRRTIIVLALGVLATAPWWPWLLVNAGAEGAWYGDTRWVFTLSIRQMWEWGLLAGLIVPVVVLGLMRRSPVLPVLVVTYSLSLIAANDIITNNVLARFTVYTPIFIGIHLVIGFEQILAWRQKGAVLGAAALILGAGTLAMVLWKIPNFNILHDDLLSGLAYVKANSTTAEKVGGHPHGMGRWVGALTTRAWGIPWGSGAPAYFREEYENLKCTFGWAPCSPGTVSEFHWLIVDWDLVSERIIQRAQTETAAGIRGPTVGFGQVADGFELITAIVPRLEGYYVVEQRGKVWLLDPSDGSRVEVYDLSSHVALDSIEQGLLNLTFGPDGEGYVYYTRLSDGAGVLATLSGVTLLIVPQPTPNHNGGGLALGPDGALYLGTGDGGDANLSGPLHGKVIRVDLGARVAEVWASGFRNPWRMAWGPEGLWVADVGQHTAEEINLVVEGGDYGWPESEGAGGGLHVSHALRLCRYRRGAFRRRLRVWRLLYQGDKRSAGWEGNSSGYPGRARDIIRPGWRKTPSSGLRGNHS